VAPRRVSVMRARGRITVTRSAGFELSDERLLEHPVRVELEIDAIFRFPNKDRLNEIAHLMNEARPIGCPGHASKRRHE